MSEENQKPFRFPRTNLTRNLPKPNAYAVALNTEFKDFAFNEERAPLNNGQWRKKVFNTSEDKAMDVEIGTGTGMHFAYHAQKDKNRYLVGLELKYKPLIQSIRRAQLGGWVNSAICRYHAFDIDLLFAKDEINNVYIHFPDPWVTPRKPKNRVVNRDILETIYKMQRPGSFIEFKTDSREYFLWSLDEIKETRYRVEFQTLNLHKDGGKYLESNFQTDFEKLFMKKGFEINYIRLVKD
jgi:tRNA (guanine-N7-)-methyltransferase